MVHANHLDVVLLPTTSKGTGGEAGKLEEGKVLDVGEEGGDIGASGSMTSPLISRMAVASADATGGRQQQRSRKRRGAGGLLFRHHYTVGGDASLSSCVTVSPQTHHQPSFASSKRRGTRHADCSACQAAATLCDNNYPPRRHSMPFFSIYIRSVLTIVHILFFLLIKWLFCHL